MRSHCRHILDCRYRSVFSEGFHGPELQVKAAMKQAFDSCPSDQIHRVDGMLAISGFAPARQRNHGSWLHTHLAHCRRTIHASVTVEA